MKAALLAPPRRYAFFDVDDTLIAIKSMFDFFAYWCAKQEAPEMLRCFNTTFARARAEGQPREELNRLYYRFLRGVGLAELTGVGRDWFRERFHTERPPYLAPAIARLRAHQGAGVTPVFVSGSMRPLLQPLADELGVAHCLCTPLLLDDQDRLTGEIGAPQTIGAGKVEAVLAFLQRQGARAGDCFAYGDDISDTAMLEAVGTPVAVGSAPDLAALARQRGWEHLRL